MSRGTDRGRGAACLATLLLVILTGPIAGAQQGSPAWELSVTSEGDRGSLSLTGADRRVVANLASDRSSLELLRTQGGQPLRTVLLALSLQVGPAHDPVLLALDGGNATLSQVTQGAATGLRLTFNGSAAAALTVWMSEVPTDVGPWTLEPGSVLVTTEVTPPADRANATSRLLVQAWGQGALARNGTALWWQTGPEVAMLSWTTGAGAVGARPVSTTNGTALLWLQQGPDQASAVVWHVGPAPSPGRLEGVGDWRLYAAGAVAALLLVGGGLAATVRGGRR